MSSVFITCAVTGSGDTVGKSDKVPVTPEQIADDCIAAARPARPSPTSTCATRSRGAPARDPDLYAEVVERVRASDVDVVINLTAGMGGDLTLGSVEQPLPLDDAGTDMAGATERLEHVRRLLPEICTLDCGTMNFGEGDYVMTNTTAMLKEMARQIQALGVRPEIEVFDTGHLWQARSLVDEGLIDDPVMVQLCMGIPWGAPPDINTFMAMVNNLPDDWTFSAFSIGRKQLEYVALATIAGGNVRVGLEDNLYLGRGQLASNADLVARAVEIVERHRPHDQGPGRGARRSEADQAWLTRRSRRAAAIGCGVIGAGWIARLRLNGVDVTRVRPVARRRPDHRRRCTTTRVLAWRELDLEPAARVDRVADGARRRSTRRSPTQSSSSRACPNGSTSSSDAHADRRGAPADADHRIVHLGVPAERCSPSHSSAPSG